MKKVFGICVFISALLVFSGSLFDSNQKINHPTFIYPKIDTLTEISLGALLFNDPILSLDSTIACKSCHLEEFAFSDTIPFSSGMGKAQGKRNAPSVMNTINREHLFWDGRAKNLADQMHFPVQDGLEMALKFSEAIQRIQKHPFYQKAFEKIYHQQPDSTTLVSAIAAFEGSLETSNTPNDRWLNDDTLHGRGMSQQQIRGRDVFRSEKAKCLDCHFTPDFTGDEFLNIGIFNGKEYNDSGRFLITRKPEDIGKFRVPGLRNVAVTAPYMHNGMFSTLRQVIDYYDNPKKFISNSVQIDARLSKPLGLTEQEKQDLEAFLRALTDDRFSKKFPNNR